MDQPLPASVGDACEADVCCEGSNVFVVWEDQRGGRTDIYFNRSGDGGLTWHPEDIRIDVGTPPGAFLSDDARICCDGPRLYVVWIQSDGAQPAHLYFNRSLDGGLTWLPAAVKLDKGNLQAVLLWNFDICCTDDDVVVVWSDRRSGDDAVYLTQSSDAGATWSGEQQVGGGSSTSAYRPAVCCAEVGGNLHIYVAWKGSGVTFDRSLDGGLTWLAQDLRLDTGNLIKPWDAHICCDGPNVYVGWTDGQVAQWNASVDSGGTFLGVRDLKTAGGGTSALQSLCCEGSNVYALFEDTRDGARDVYFQRSTDGGATLLPGGEIRLDIADAAGAHDSFQPQIHCEGSDLVALWADDRTGSTTLWSTRSANQGTSWFVDVRVDTPGGPSDARERDVHLAGSGSNAYAVWADDRDVPGLVRPRLNRTLDAGANWLPADVRPWQGTPEGDNAASGEPALCLSGGTLHAVWTDARLGDDRIFYNRSLDGGVTWRAADLQLDAGTPALQKSRTPVICCSGARVYVAWERSGSDNQEQDIYFNRSVDAGATWLSAPARLNAGVPTLTSSALGIDMCCEGLNVYVTWMDNRNGAFDILFRRSGDGGATWPTAPERLDVGDTPGANHSFGSQIRCDGGRVYVVYDDARNGLTDVYFNRSLDGGASWLSPDVRLDVGDLPGAGTSSVSWQQGLCCEGASVYVAWGDERSGESDIYFNRSLDAGQTWMATDVRLDVGDAPGAADSRSPVLGCSGGRVYVAWEDKRGGSKVDVYFNRSLDDGAHWMTADVRLDAGDLPGADHSTTPRIACDGDEVIVTWADQRVAAPGPYLNASFDAGATWLSAEMLVSSSPRTWAYGVRCLLDASWLVVGWSDSHESPGDIRLNRAPR